MCGRYQRRSDKQCIAEALAVANAVQQCDSSLQVHIPSASPMRSSLLRVSKNTLCKWVRDSGLPAARMPDNCHRFDPVQVAQWIEGRQV